VRERLAELHALWSRLESTTQEKARLLFDANRSELLDQSLADVKQWLGGLQQQLHSGGGHEEEVRDLTNANILLKKHQVGPLFGESPGSQGLGMGNVRERAGEPCVYLRLCAIERREVRNLLRVKLLSVLKARCHSYNFLYLNLCVLALLFRCSLAWSTLQARRVGEFGLDGKSPGVNTNHFRWLIVGQKLLDKQSIPPSSITLARD
jgi:hypothetical protein